MASAESRMSPTGPDTGRWSPSTASSATSPRLIASRHTKPVMPLVTDPSSTSPCTSVPRASTSAPSGVTRATTYVRVLGAEQLTGPHEQVAHAPTRRVDSIVADPTTREPS